MPGTPRTSATGSATASDCRSTKRRESARSAAGTLLAGSAVTVEPGVYLPDRGGVRIEDTLVVGEQIAPAPELLTRFPKELAVIV